MTAVAPAAPPAVRHVEHCMGTVFTLDVRGPAAGRAPVLAAVADAVAWLHRIDRLFSTYRDDSAIRRLDRGELTTADCPPEVAHVLAECARLTEQTGGYFDCRAGGSLDPSGYVKGWAIQHVSDLLERSGSQHHSVNGGGDVQCVGTPEPGRPWAVGVTDPADRQRVLATVTGSRLAVATSGTGERGRHIVDPLTGTRPAAFTGVTVVGSRIVDADAYATAAFAMGEAAPSWLRELGVVAFLVAADGRTTRIGPGRC